MKKILLFLLVFVMGGRAYSQVTKVNHITAHIPGAGDIFKLFNQTFGVPLVWDFQSYGTYSSGGLWVGNIALETVEAKSTDVDAGHFKGIALEPAGHTDVTLPLLDSLHILHTAPDISYWSYNGARAKFYTIMVLSRLESDRRVAFICDYEQRDFINSFSAKADSILKATKGGALGLVGLEKIVIGTPDVAAQAALWKAIPGIKAKGADHFCFDAGPDLVIEPDAEDCIKEIVIKVRSSAVAKAFLAKENYLAKEGNTLLIDPQKIHGLRIILEE